LSQGSTTQQVLSVLDSENNLLINQDNLLFFSLSSAGLPVHWDETGWSRRPERSHE